MGGLKEDEKTPGDGNIDLTILVLLIKAIKPGGRLTRQFLSDTNAISARTVGAIFVNIKGGVKGLT